MTLQNQASAAAAAAAPGRDSAEDVAARPDSGGAAADDRVIEFPAAGHTANRSTLDVSPVVKVEQIRLLYQHPSLILVNLVNAALVVVVLWQVFPHRALLIWFAL